VCSTTPSLSTQNKKPLGGKLWHEIDPDGIAGGMIKIKILNDLCSFAST